MTKQIKIVIDNIKKTKDRNFVDEICNNILESLNDFPYTVSNIFFEKDKDMFYIRFNLKVCKIGDMVFCLIQEFLSCIIQTEEKINVTIDSVEEGEVGTTYKLYAYKSKEK